MVLEIIHAEAGVLAQDYQKNLEAVRRKFTQKRKDAIRTFAVGTIKFDASKIKYEPLYMASYLPKKHVNELRKELRKEDIELKTLEEALGEIVEDVSKWKDEQEKREFRKTKQITLPERPMAPQPFRSHEI